MQKAKAKSKRHRFDGQSVCHRCLGVKYFVREGLNLISRPLQLDFCPLVGRAVRFCAHTIAATTAVASS